MCVAGEEDFGIVAVEAQAAGKPVVAYGRGGSRETVAHGVTGVLFEEQTVPAVMDALAECEQLQTAPEVIAANAARFSTQAFAERLGEVIVDVRERRSRTPAAA